MAKVETVVVPDELKNVQRAALEQSDRFLHSVVQAHKSLPSDARKKIIKEQSLFGFLATFWRALSVSEKNVWRDAAAFSGITNWQLFISDNAARLRNDLELDVPPSDLWQVRAGQILIQSPATEMILKQSHPQTYFVSQKIVGAPWKSEVVKIEEVFGLPLEISLRYKSNLLAVGPTQSARYYATVWTSYQGEDIFTDFSINFAAVADWNLQSLTINSLRGIIVGYTLYFEIIGYTGEVLFDNIRAVHSGTNWALDPRCDAIDKTFSKGFAAVPPFWVPVSLPTGATFSSQYPPAL